MPSGSIHFVTNSKMSFFCGWIIFNYVIYIICNIYGWIYMQSSHISQFLYLFIHQGTLGFFPHFGYCKLYHWTYLLEIVFCILQINRQKWNCWIYFQLFEETPYCFWQWLQQLTFPPMVHIIPILSDTWYFLSFC